MVVKSSSQKGFSQSLQPSDLCGTVRKWDLQPIRKSTKRFPLSEIKLPENKCVLLLPMEERMQEEMSC